MARGEVGGYKTNHGHVPAVVRAQYDSDGNAIADSAGASTADTVDVVLLGFTNAVRTGVTVAANEGAANTNEWYDYTA